MSREFAKKKAAILFLALLLASGMLPGRADALSLCLGLRLQSVPGTVTFSGGSTEYEVYAVAEPVQTVSFQVTVPITAIACDYFVTLAPGASGNTSQRRMMRGADILNYNAYTTAAKSAVLKDLGSASASEVLTGTFSPLLLLGQTHNRAFYWTVPPGQVVAGSATRFQDTAVELKLYAGGLLGGYAEVDTKTVTFRAKVESSVDLSLVNSGGPFNIGDTSQIVDFGSLSSNASLGFDTVIRSNAGYEIRVQSQRGQKLVHQNAPSVTSVVPYTLRMNGSPVDVSGGSAVLAVTAGGTTPATGTAVPTQIQIGTLTGAEVPGNYQDVLTMTVSAH